MVYVYSGRDAACSWEPGAGIPTREGRRGASLVGSSVRSRGDDVSAAKDAPEPLSSPWLRGCAGLRVPSAPGRSKARVKQKRSRRGRGEAPLFSLVPRGRKFPENGKNRARLGSALCASRAASRGCSGCFTRCCPAPAAKFLNPCGDCPGIRARGRARGPSAAPPPPSAGV